MFGALIPLQPVEWTDGGLLCAPTWEPHQKFALATCPLPTSPVPAAMAWPETPCALVAGWYRRTDDHAPAPPGLRELFQASGTAFGPGDHPTTAMCLAAIEALPSGDAVDLGCGSGLLAQAWARLGRGRVLAVDLDPAAVAQTRSSADRSGVGSLVVTRRQAVETFPSADLTGVAVFANIPAGAHTALLRRFEMAPAAVVLSGVRPADAGPLVAAYRRLGMRRARSSRMGGFECHVLVGGR